MRMPGFDVDKADYPSCNRAFALRMMNPTVYADQNTSPLDKQVLPLHKKFTAKPATSSPSPYQVQHTDYVSVDEISLSPASSTASLSEMELYDIDENSYSNKRQFSSHVNKSSSSSNDGEQLNLQRSYSSVDGFFERQSIARSTMPTKRCKSVARNANHSQSLSPKATGSSLRRTQSLKGGRPNVMQHGSNTPARVKSTSGATTPQQKSPTTNIRVVATKSSQLRAKVTEIKQKQKHRSLTEEQTRYTAKQPTTAMHKRIRTSSTSSGKSRSLNTTEESIFSESDSSSTIFSEIDAYNPRFNPRTGKPVKMNGHYHHSPPTRQNRQKPPAREAPLQYNQASTPSPTPKLNVNNQYSSSRAGVSKPDTFSSKLSEVCRLISERHPGDFQILETLIEMQTAYEERNDLVKNTISGLRDKVRFLEHKCANSPNIPGLVIPLMRATNAFQTQLQNIMDAYHVPGKDQCMQFPEYPTAGATKVDEIATEANLVANRIEKLHVSTQRVNHTSATNNTTTTMKNGDVGETDVLESSSNSDKENMKLCNGGENKRTSDHLASYEIISESPGVLI